MTHSYLLWAVAVYFLLMTLYGFLAGRRETDESFMVASRKQGAFFIGLSIAVGWTDTGLIIFYLAEFRQYGWLPMFYALGAVLSFILYALAMPRLSKVSRKHSMYTIADFFCYQWSLRIGVAVAMLNFMLMALWLVVLFLVGGQIFAAVTALSFVQGVGIMLAVVLPYMLLGGFRAVLGTDTFQYVFLVIALMALFWAFGSLGEVRLTLPSAEIASFGWEKSVFAVVSIISWSLISGDVWQRIYAARSTKTAQKGMLVAALGYMIFPICLALFAFNLVPAGTDDPFMYLLTDGLTPALTQVLLLAVFLAVTSTIDTATFSAAAALTNDILRPLGLTQSHHLRWATFIAIPILLLGAAVISFYAESIMGLIYGVMGMTIAVGPALGLALFSNQRHHEPYIFTSLMLGLAAFAATKFTGANFPGQTLLPFFVGLFVLAPTIKRRSAHP